MIISTQSELFLFPGHKIPKSPILNPRQNRRISTVVHPPRSVHKIPQIILSVKSNSNGQKKHFFWSFFYSFCAFCAFLWPNLCVFSGFVLLSLPTYQVGLRLIILRAGACPAKLASPSEDGCLLSSNVALK